MDAIFRFTRGPNIEGRICAARAWRVGPCCGHSKRRNRTETHARRRNHEIAILVQMISEMKGLAGVFDGIEMNCIHVAGHAPALREGFYVILPLGR